MTQYNNIIKNKLTIDQTQMTLPNNTDIKRISKVFQGLADYFGDNHQSSEGITIPRDIQKLVLNLRVAHEAFEKGIITFMHREMRDLSSAKTVERIIGESPYYLTAKDIGGDLPIQNAAMHYYAFPTLIPFLAKAGIQHKVGGESGRGGLLLECSDEDNTLFNMARNGHCDAMKALLNAEPPLLVKSDVSKYFLIHAAAFKLNMMKMMIEIDPAPLFQKDNYSCVPIYNMDNRESFKYLLKSAMEYDPKHSSIGGLFTKDDKGQICINRVIENLGKEATIARIEQVLSAHKDIPILHKVILHTPEYVHDFITAFPDSCFLRDENGRLPIHVALETGMKWSSELLSIMNANTEYLGEVDPVTKLCLGALAAVKPTCGLRTINYLMLKHPKDAKVIASTSNEEPNKRRKLND
jgi:hypothetical protein